MSQRLASTIAIAALAGLLAPTPATAGDAEAGKTPFASVCSSCHGMGGKGDGPVGAVLQPPPRDFTQGDFKFDTDDDGKAGTDTDLKNVITNGAGAYGGSMLMAPWGTMLSPEDVENIIAYIRSLKP